MNSIDLNYNFTKQLFWTNHSKILADMSKSSYPQSFKALFYCQKKIDSILSGIETIKISNEDSFYPIQVLSRALFEHFLVGDYIWTRARIDKNDNCGIEYYAQYRLAELFKRENYNLGLEGIEKNIPKYANFENFKSRFEGSEFEINQQDVDEIHSIGNQFEVKSIYNYVLNKIYTDNHFKEVHKNFIHFLREYNNLSSYIHGGPSAENETYHEPIIDKEKIMCDEIDHGKIATRVIKEHILMLLFSENYEYKEILESIPHLKVSGK